MSELMTVSEVAWMVRVEDTTVKRWVKVGILEAVVLPHVNAGQGSRIKGETLDQLRTRDCACGTTLPVTFLGLRPFQEESAPHGKRHARDDPTQRSIQLQETCILLSLAIIGMYGMLSSVESISPSFAY